MKNIGNDPRSLFKGNHFSSICGSVCIPGAKHGMLELIPQTLFFLERASANTEGGSGYRRLGRIVRTMGMPKQ